MNSIQMPAVKATTLVNAWVTNLDPSMQPKKVHFLPESRAQTFEAGEEVLIQSDRGWVKALFLENESVEGPLVFANLGIRDLQDVARKEVQTPSQFTIMGFSIAALGSALMLMWFEDARGDLFPWLLLGVSLVVCALFASRALSLSTKPAEAIRKAKSVKPYAVFLPADIDAEEQDLQSPTCNCSRPAIMEEAL